MGNSNLEFNRLKSRYDKLEKNRLSLQRLAIDAQRLSKQSIFAAQKNDLRQADMLADSAKDLLVKAERLAASDARLANEGSWRQSLEEYCEACLFLNAIKGKPLLPAQKLTDDPGIIIGAMSDLLGELVRYATNAAIARDQDKISKAVRTAETVVEFFNSLNLTGHLRAKNDQARQHVRRLEEIRYDSSLRR